MPANINGIWGSLAGWPLIGIHAVLTQDGKVLSFGTDLTGRQGAAMYHDVWDPVTNTHTTLNHAAHTSTDIFCANAIVVPGTDNILIGGGDARPLGTINVGVSDVNNFNINTNQITPDSHGDMAYARWYATAISLNNGQVLQLGGSNGLGQVVKTPEIYTPGEGWRTLSGATDQNTSANYDRAFVRADGKVVYFNGSGNVMLLDTTGTGSITKIATLPFGYNWESPATQFAAGKVLINDSTTGLWVMDFNQSTPSFVKVGNITAERGFASMTVLADGRVLINGGSIVTNHDSSAIKTAYIWNPVTNSLTSAGEEAVPRLYHSSSMLLPDGTVLSMGGGSFGGGPGEFMADQQNAQIYRPPYLYDANGNLATRPAITDRPEHIEAGTTFTLKVDNAADIQKLTLVKAGAATHDFNMNAGMITLSFVVGADNTLTVTVPSTAQGATAGSWMLFAWNSAGVPSVAPVIEIDPNFGTGAEVVSGNLLVNGSFETAATIPTASFEILDNVAGWHSTVNNIELWKSGLNGLAAKDGATFIEMDAERGSIYQDVTTKAGQSYQLTFDFAGRPGAVASSKMDVVWNGIVIATINPADAVFKAYTFNVVGTGGEDRLTFRSIAGDTDGLGGLLDHVILKAAPIVPPAAGELLNNGNMESIRVATGSGWQSFTNVQMTGWKNAGQDNVVLVNHLGSQMLDLDPAGNADELYQQVQTKAGQSYVLNFSAIGTVANSSAFDVLWNSIKIATVDPSTTSLQNFTFAVTGTGGLDKLSFRELATQNDYTGAYLDNVSLKEGAIPPAQNLIANGAMETNRIAGGALWQSFNNTTSSGWKNGGQDYVVLVNHLGSQMLDLDPAGNNDELYQSVQTEAGRTYTLSFDAIGTIANSSSFDVLWNGVKVATIDPSTSVLQRYTFLVTGTGGADRLTFRELTGQNDFLGAYLDNVSLVAGTVTPPTMNIMANGDMEAVKIAAGNAWQVFDNTGVTGWKNANDTKVVLVNHLGSQMLDLDPAGNNDELYQMVQTTAGQSYTLGFDAIGTVAGSSKFQVVWNGVVVATIDPATTSLQHFTLRLTGTGGLDKLAFRELTAENNFLGAYLDNVSLVATQTGAVAANHDSHDGNHVMGTEGTDVLTGTIGLDHVMAGGGNDRINTGGGDDVIMAGSGNDIITGSYGADDVEGGDGIDTISFRDATSGVTVDLATGEGTRGDATGDTYSEVENIQGSNFADIFALGNVRGRVTGLGGDDRMQGGAANDSLLGGAGNDMLNGKHGTDSLSGGTGSDRFIFALGDSGQTANSADRILDLDTGAVGTGDTIDFVTALTIGGSASAATPGRAAINASTGVASFASGSGGSFADAIGDIARSFTAQGDTVGEFAVFQVASTGNYYLIVSDGVAGVTANDVLVRMDGVTSISGISLAGGDLTLLA